MSDFSVWTSQTFNAPQSGNEVAVSADINNPGDDNSLRIVIDYETLTPNGTVNNIGASYNLALIVEGKSSSGKWFAIGGQNQPINDTTQGHQREIIISPAISGSDSGIDEVIQVAGETQARITRVNGKLGSTFRIRLLIQENDPGGAGAFQNCTVSCYGERYTV